MKITLDIPNTTTCAFINYIFINEDIYSPFGMSMGVKSLESDDLVDGNEIKVEPYKGGDTE